MSLRATSAGLEQQMMARAGAAFAADEVNHLGQNTRDQGQRVYDLAFMVSHGVEKERYNDSAAARAPLSFVATSNASLPRLLSGQDPVNADAVLVRFNLIQADAGAGHGVFDKVPKGFKNSGAAIKALRVALTQSHGHAADAFLTRLVQERAADKQSSIKQLTAYRDSFLRWVNADPNDHPAQRRSEYYAVMYAAGKLAVKWKILPLARLKTLLLRSYRRSTAVLSENAASARLTAKQRVQAYIFANRSKMRDLDKLKPKSLTGSRLNTRPGFFKTITGRRCLIIRPKRWKSEFGADAHRMLSELNSAGFLCATDHFQTQTRVRSNKPKDRVYAIAVSQMLPGSLLGGSGSWLYRRLDRCASGKQPCASNFGGRKVDTNGYPTVTLPTQGYFRPYEPDIESGTRSAPLGAGDHGFLSYAQSRKTLLIG